METPMNDVEQAEAHEEQEAKKAPAHPRPGDEHAYEDSWYQVLRRRAEDEPDAAK
jgi:hypothetical protein